VRIPVSAPFPLALQGQTIGTLFMHRAGGTDPPSWKRF
jgi:hypothetical protein